MFNLIPCTTTLHQLRIVRCI